MYFPWVGMFEQIRLCDVYIHYDDVQFSKGSFTNRVQIKTSTTEGFKWLAVPLRTFTLGTKINEILIDDKKDWRNDHYKLLDKWFEKAPFKNEALELFEKTAETSHLTIADLSIKSLEVVSEYYGLLLNKKVFKSSEQFIDGKSSKRVFDYVKKFNGTEYITGLGALKYLDHDLFENNGINVQYMDYRKKEYPQLYGAFNPYVSILDLIANTGKEGIKYICSSTINWKEIKQKK